MKLNYCDRRTLDPARDALIDLEFERAKRPQPSNDDAAADAADMLAAFRAGRVPFRDVLAALVAPYAQADTEFDGLTLR